MQAPYLLILVLTRSEFMCMTMPLGSAFHFFLQAYLYSCSYEYTVTAKAEVALCTIALDRPWPAIPNFTPMLTDNQALPLLCGDGRTSSNYHYYCYYLVSL